MKQILLDTTAIIDYLRGNKEIIDVIDAFDGEINSSYLCLAELYEGVYRSPNSDKVEKRIGSFFSTLSVVYALDREICKTFGCLRSTLNKAGIRIEDIDIFIAATCIAHNASLVTRNIKHFSRIKGLKVIGY